jgi:hypothetical protein
MRTLFLLSLSTLLTSTSFAQTAPPAGSRPAPAPTPPAQGAPAPRRAAAAPVSRSGIALTVTDSHGSPIPGVRVAIAGSSDRNGVTDTSGQVNFVAMQPGTYRVRFDGDKVTPFEREVTVKAGQPTVVDVTLSPAPPPAPAPASAPAPAAAAAAPLGPAGQPAATSILDVLDKQFVGKQPRRETLLSCSGNTRTTMVQLNEPLPDRLYDTAEAEYYVIGGEGTARLAGRDTPVVTSSVVSVPRGTLHSFARKGNRPLILLAVLSGEPCEQAK